MNVRPLHDRIIIQRLDPLMTSRRALAFIRRHGVVLESAREQRSAAPTLRRGRASRELVGLLRLG
jgi:hypothetical protein